MMDGVTGSPRYRCLVDMWSNVIPNGTNCVEMLRNLCPVSPSMYYVGVSKVPSWAGGLALAMPWGRAAKVGGLMALSPLPALPEGAAVPGAGEQASPCPSPGCAHSPALCSHLLHQEALSLPPPKDRPSAEPGAGLPGQVGVPGVVVGGHW